MKELYFSTDIETDGPIPGPNSMLSFGVVALTEKGEELGTFEANLALLTGAKPDSSTMDWWATQPEAWEKCRQNLQNPADAMNRFVSWANKTCGKDYMPVMVCYPAGFDFLFMYWYIMNFVGQSPFSHSCLDVRSYVSGMRKVGYKRTGKKFWPKRWFPKNLPHTHIALDDAREQGQAFINMLRENNNVKS